MLPADCFERKWDGSEFKFAGVFSKENVFAFLCKMTWNGLVVTSYQYKPTGYVTHTHNTNLYHNEDTHKDENTAQRHSEAVAMVILL